MPDRKDPDLDDDRSKLDAELGPDDDGWGDAGEDDGPTPEDERGEGEWNDPANLEERVAALHEKRQQPPSQTGPIPAVDPADIEVYKAQLDAEEARRDAESADKNSSESPEDEVDRASWRVSDESSDDSEATSEERRDGSDAEGADDELDVDLLAAAGLRTKSSPRKARRPRGPGVLARLSPKQRLVLVGGALLFVVLATCAVLGYFNSQNFYLRCKTTSVVAVQGRFWPWGESRLEGPAFAPLAVPSDVTCSDKRFDDREELELAFLQTLLAQSSALLSKGDAEQVSLAEAQLEQALLLTRDPSRKASRDEAERLQGDVIYWRGAAEITKAVESLNKSAEFFHEAASKRPRHSNDANDWSEHARFLQKEIDKGPRALRKDEKPKAAPHFQGLGATPLPPPDPVPDVDRSRKPVEKAPTPDSDAPDSDAGVAPVADEEAREPAPDASLPRGGVLL